MKKSILITMLLGIFAVCSTGCLKNLADIVPGGNDAVLTITPEKLMSYTGSNWKDIDGQFRNKKDYLYTKLNNGNILAAASLPARDPQAPAHNYKIIFNIDQDNKVSFVHVESTDTLDIVTGNKLFLYFYDHAFSKLEGIYRTWATYNYEQQPPITVDALINKVRALNCVQPYLSVDATEMHMDAGYSERYHNFNFNMSSF